MLATECFAQLLNPLALIVCMLGLLGWWVQQIDVVPVEKWPQPAHFLYQLLH